MNITIIIVLERIYSININLPLNTYMQNTLTSNGEVRLRVIVGKFDENDI